MKLTAYIRVARNPDRAKAQIAANLKPNTAPLTNSRGDALPTIAFAIKLDIPDAMFSRASQVIAELTIPEESAEIAATVRELPRAS